MKPALTNDSLHNPFHNRFHDPVKHRSDEMQAHAYMLWLKERNQGTCLMQGNSYVLPRSISMQQQTTPNTGESWNTGRIFAGALTLFLALVFSIAVLSKVF